MSNALKVGAVCLALAGGAALAQTGSTGVTTPGTGRMGPEQGSIKAGERDKGMRDKDMMHEGMMHEGMPEHGKLKGPDIKLTMHELVTEVRAQNQAEIDLATMVLNDQVSGGVRELARMIAEDHRNADQELSRIAQRGSYKFGRAGVGSDKLRAKHAHRTATREYFSRLQGETLERAWLASMVMSHDTGVSFLSKVRTQADASLRQYIDAQLPKMAQHRQRAYDLLGRNVPRPAQVTR